MLYTVGWVWSAGEQEGGCVFLLLSRFHVARLSRFPCFQHIRENLDFWLEGMGSGPSGFGLWQSSKTGKQQNVKSTKVRKSGNMRNQRKC